MTPGSEPGSFKQTRTERLVDDGAPGIASSRMERASNDLERTGRSTAVESDSGGSVWIPRRERSTPSAYL